MYRLQKCVSNVKVLNGEKILVFKHPVFNKRRGNRMVGW